MLNIRIMKEFLLRAGRDLRLRAVVIGAAACVWWGVLYPELCFADGTYERTAADADCENGCAAADSADGILRASGDEIAVCSRILEWIGQRTDKD